MFEHKNKFNIKISRNFIISLTLCKTHSTDPGNFPNKPVWPATEECASGGNIPRRRKLAHEGTHKIRLKLSDASSSKGQSCRQTKANDECGGNFSFKYDLQRTLLTTLFPNKSACFLDIIYTENTHPCVVIAIWIVGVNKSNPRKD